MIRLTEKEKRFTIKEINKTEPWSQSEITDMIYEHEVEVDLQDLYTLVGWLENINFRRKRGISKTKL